MTTCPHGKPLGAECLVCKAEAVCAAFDIKVATGARLDEWAGIPKRPSGMTDAAVRAGIAARLDAGEIELQGDVDRLARRRPPIHMTSTFRKVPHPRAVAIVALRRIVDRVVSDTVGSQAQDEILRIALKALKDLEK